MPGRAGTTGVATVSLLTIAVMGGATARAGADMELGRYLASECMTCHRAQAAASSIPNLSNIPRDHFVSVIKAYRQKELPNPAMQNVAGRLSDEDIESLALYFSATRQP